MNKTEHYKVVLDDLEKKLEQLRADCVDLRNSLEQKESLMNETEHTISFIKAELLPDIEEEEVMTVFQEEELPDTERKESPDIEIEFKKIEPEKQPEMFPQETLKEVPKKEKPKNEEQLSFWRELAKINDFNETNQSPLSLSRGAELILEEAGTPLHINRLAQELAKLGRFADNRILNGTIRKDSRNRFVNLGRNVWDLRRRYEQAKEEGKEDNQISKVRLAPFTLTQFGLALENEYTPEKQSEVTLGDAVFTILEKEGKPLHLDFLVKEIEKYGRFTESIKLRDTIRTDTRKRFIHLKKGIWDLRSRHEQPTVEQSGEQEPDTEQDNVTPSSN